MALALQSQRLLDRLSYEALIAVESYSKIEFQGINQQNSIFQLVLCRLYL
jgi:hypothetical protein